MTVINNIIPSGNSMSVESNIEASLSNSDFTVTTESEEDIVASEIDSEADVESEDQESSSSDEPLNANDLGDY